MSSIDISNLNIDGRTITLFVVTLLTFMAIDMIFVSSVTGPLFKSTVNGIQGTPLNLRMIPAMMAYVVMTFALFYFVLLPHKDNPSQLTNSDYISAAILGLVIFGVFDLTNRAIFENYGLFTATIDIAWGGALFVIVPLTVSFIYNKLAL